jgi:hypothetical protein
VVFAGQRNPEAQAASGIRLSLMLCDLAPSPALRERAVLRVLFLLPLPLAGEGWGEGHLFTSPIISRL